MSGLSGWEVAEAVRSESAVTPVILVTGSATDLDAQRAGAFGVAILHKPVPLAELRTTVRQALGSPGPGGPAG